MWYLLGIVFAYIIYKIVKWLFAPDEYHVDDESVGAYHFYHKDDE